MGVREEKVDSSERNYMELGEQKYVYGYEGPQAVPLGLLIKSY
jgi:hypothetical protein